MKQLGLAILAALWLVGCGGGGAAPPPAPVIKQVENPAFGGGTGSLIATVPQVGASGQPITVTATTTAPGGSTIPTTVVRDGDQVTVSAELPPNLTTQAQSYTVTLTVQEGSQSVVQTQQVVVPGLDAPAVGGGTPPVDGPGSPSFRLRP